MNAKKWIIIFISIAFLIVLTLQLFLMKKNIPLRFSNSISYDAKLNFIKNNQLLDNADTLIVGSSMALNNVNGITLEEHSSQIHKVANLASWGLNMTEDLKLLQLIDLKDVKRIIISTSYSDFSMNFHYQFDYTSINAALHNHFSIKPYLKRISTAMRNIGKYYHYDKIYLNKHHYKSLLFDHTGSAILDFTKDDIDKKRWDNPIEFEEEFLDTSYEAFMKMVKLCQKNNIQLIVVSSPIHMTMLYKYPHIKKRVELLVQKLKNSSKEEGFTYIDAHANFHCKGLCFVDTDHLNKDATVLYSDLIIKEAGLE